MSAGRGKRAARPRAAAARGAGGMLVGILIGLVLGILLALGVAWYINQAQLPFQNKGAKPLPEVAGARPATEPEAAKPVPTPLPGKPGDKPIERPRFDFYKILPGGEEAAPPPLAAEPAPAAVPEEMLYLQAGSFTKPEDADNLKAKLALMGIEASVVPATFPDKGTFHRVRVGPYGKPEEMARARALLAENGIQAKVVKARDGTTN